MPRLFKTFLLCLALLPGVAAAQLPKEVAEALRSAGIPLSDVGVVVQEVGAARPRLTMNSHQPLNPASTMKLVTTYAALDLLGPAYRWKTEAYLDGENLVLRGRGDPKLNAENFWMLLRNLRRPGPARARVPLEDGSLSGRGKPRAARSRRSEAQRGELLDAPAQSPPPWTCSGPRTAGRRKPIWTGKTSCCAVAAIRSSTRRTSGCSCAISAAV